jgi:DNA-binding MarR family transcriptional regulator
LSKKEQAREMADLTFELLDRCQLKRERMAKKLHLTTAEFELIRRFQSDAFLSVGELARRMNLSNSRLTRILDGLVKKKLVNRELGQKDRRVMEITLSEEGRSIQTMLEEDYVGTHEEIVQLLPDGAIDSVLMAMSKLRDAMNKWVQG